MFCCCTNNRNNCCCQPNPKRNCCCRCCRAPEQASASGEGFTLGVNTWNGIELADVVFDGFRLENMLSGGGGGALVAQRSGCYELGYLVTISDFATGDPGYEGIDVFMSVNGDPLLPPFRVDPAGAFDFPAVATDKRAENLKRGDRITLTLHPTAEGDLTITPSAWLEARRTGDTC